MPQPLVKAGMGGSRNGKNRYEGTETLKRSSKKRRRRQGQAACSERDS